MQPMVEAGVVEAAGAAVDAPLVAVVRALLPLSNEALRLG